MGRSKATTVSKKLQKKKYQHRLPPSTGGVYEIGMKKKSKRGATARDTEKLYIGQSGKDMKGRVQHHIREATKKRRPKQAIQRKLKKIIKEGKFNQVVVKSQTVRNAKCIEGDVKAHLEKTSGQKFKYNRTKGNSCRK